MFCNSEQKLINVAFIINLVVHLIDSRGMGCVFSDMLWCAVFNLVVKLFKERGRHRRFRGAIAVRCYTIFAVDTHHCL